jgi:hypothetical protein
MNYICHMVRIPSYVFADTEKDHPLIAPDPPVLILPHRNKMQGFDAMLDGS